MAFSLTVPLPAGMSRLYNLRSANVQSRALYCPIETGHTGMYKCLYCTKVFRYMVYRVSISEDTMERLRKYVRIVHEHAGLTGKPGNSKWSYTVEDIVCELLAKEGL